MSEKLVNLFDMEADDASMDFLDKSTRSSDGIYRANPKDAKDKSKGYVSTIRFLPNLLEDNTIGPSAIEKHVHYAKLPDYSDLIGYYDSLINFGEKCPLTTLYWKLRNSKNQAEVERAELISRTTKYYSYILVIEDEQHPEYEGKIMTFSYGFKLKEKINLERTGENSEGKRCNVFDPANGKDFRLIVKDIGGFSNYDSSIFRSVSPLKIWDEAKSRFIEIPTEWDEERSKFLVKSAKVTNKIIEFLNTKTVSIDDNVAKPWTEETKAKVEKIIDILSGNDTSHAKASINNATTSMGSSSVESDDLGDDNDDLDDFFGDDE